MAIFDRVRKVWNAFRDRPEDDFSLQYGGNAIQTGASPYRMRRYTSNERSIISSIYTKLSMDVSGILFKHVKLDKDGRYLEDIPGGLTDCFTFEANIDQSPRAFRQDIAMTLFDKGVAVIVPVQTSVKPVDGVKFDVYSLRVGEIVKWYPRHVCVSVYNEELGIRQELVLEKRFVAIIENPLYAVMNEFNSTLQRLIRKLNLLDVVDEQSSSGKLDIIIQLPYVIKSEARRQQAEQRRTEMEVQLKGSQYGIAYADGTEKITQLNRPAENNLLKQVEYLTDLLYNQLGLTKKVMDGTASEDEMLNYNNRTVEPVVDAIVEAKRRAFIGLDRTHGSESIMYFRDPFKLVPVTAIAELADKLIRNQVVSANEIRGFIGLKPSADPTADKLMNPNMPQDAPVPTEAAPVDEAEPDNEIDTVLDETISTMDSLLNDLGVE